MKNRLRAPSKADLLQNDAPIIRIVKVAIPAFIILSSLTVFLGVQTYISEYIRNASSVKRFLGYAASYTVFSLIPDLLNVLVFAYIVRSLLKGFYKDLSSWILIASSVLICIGLTHYSYKMSRTAALSIANEMVVEPKQENLAVLDSLLSEKQTLIKNEYEQYKSRIEKEMKQRLANNSAYYSKLIEIEQNDIESWKTRKSDENAAYIDVKIRKIKNKIVRLEVDKLEAEKEIMKGKMLGFDSLASKKAMKERALFDLYRQDRTTAKQVNDEKRNKSKILLASFEKEFTWIAGKSVFIILFLTMIREVLHHRNGLTITSKVKASENLTTAFKEILLLPIVILSRFTINKVRKIYKSLPDLEEPVIYSKIVVHTNPNAGFSSTFSGPGDSANPIHQKENQINQNRQHDNRIYDTSTLRICQHCKTKYVYRHHKQKYCSDDCRKTAWELRNGRKLKFKPKKK